MWCEEKLFTVLANLDKAVRTGTQQEKSDAAEQAATALEAAIVATRRSFVVAAVRIWQHCWAQSSARMPHW